MDYYEQLLDERWIQKRRKIMKRDGWMCTVCGTKKDLVVHHTFYRQGMKPWEYPNDSLLTLCQPCHHKYHTEHELTISHPKKKNKGPVPKKRKPQIKIEKKKKRRVIPLTTIQAQRPMRFRKKVNNEWVEVVRNVI
jgi:5-methylcytosine-specific restriction endonuclease McrA